MPYTLRYHPRVADHDLPKIPTETQRRIARLIEEAVDDHEVLKHYASGVDVIDNCERTKRVFASHSALRPSVTAWVPKVPSAEPSGCPKEKTAVRPWKQGRQPRSSSALITELRNP